MEDSDTSTQNNTHEDYNNIVKAASSEVWEKIIVLRNIIVMQ